MAKNVIQQLEKELQNKIDNAVAAARNSAKELASTIQTNAPVDTGALRDSVSIVNTPEGATITIGGGSVDYADIVEAEEPFIEPAISGFRSGYEASLRKAVEG
jgi:hypothetical protein